MTDRAGSSGLERSVHGGIGYQTPPIDILHSPSICFNSISAIVVRIQIISAFGIAEAGVPD